MSAEETALADENTLLGAIIDDMQRKLSDHQQLESEVNELRAQLKQTEDALLDMHAEDKQLRERASHLDAALQPERKLRLALQHRVKCQAAEADATERVLADELATLERQWLAETDEGYASSLKIAAEEAIAGMHEAQAECKWLHEQLQAALKADATGGDGSGSAALRMQLASSLAPACSPAAAALPAGSSSSIRSSREAHGLDAATSARPAVDGTAALVAVDPLQAGAGGSNAHALRTAYVRAVQRCHELQLHSARSAESDANLRPELLRCRERIVELQHEADDLRTQLRRAAASRSECGGGGYGGGHGGGHGGENASPRGVCMTPPSPAEPVAPPPTSALAPPQFSQGSRGGPDAPRTGGSGGRGSTAHSSSGGARGSTACSTSYRAPPPVTPREASAASARAEAAALRTELARANAHIGALERALERRESEHRNDLDALERAEREAAASHRTLMSERSWVQSLDEMRLDDLSTIMQLEMRLQQWQTRFER